MSVIIRDILPTDYHYKYFDCLNELTSSPLPTEKEFINQINEINNSRARIIVIEYSNPEIPNEVEIVGTASIWFELKLIHNLGVKGHIEDVVVKKEFRKYGLGKLLIEQLKEIAMENKCYKVILSCNEENKPFYESCLFTSKEVEMHLYMDVVPDTDIELKTTIIDNTNPVIPKQDYNIKESSKRVLKSKNLEERLIECNKKIKGIMFNIKREEINETKEQLIENNV